MMFQTGEDGNNSNSLQPGDCSANVADNNDEVNDSNTDGELMSSSGSDGLDRQFSASSSDGLSDKEDVLDAVKSQVRLIFCSFVTLLEQKSSANVQR